MSKESNGGVGEADATAKPATARRKGGNRVPESAENFEHTIRRVVIEKSRRQDDKGQLDQ